MSLGTIFIVDDTPTNLGVLFNYLDAMQFKVLVSVNGQSALEAIPQAQPDVILLDVMMPGMDGFETCRQLKANPLTRDIPVMFMTALTDLVDEVQGLEIGAVDYITKPFKVEILLARVRTHLKLRQAQRQLEAQNQQLQEEIQQRQRVEASLVEERNLLRTMIDHIPDYIFVKDRESRFLLNNAAHLRVLGAASQEEVFGKTDLDVFPKELAARYLADDQDVMASGRALLNHEETTMTTDGQPQWLLTTKVPLRNQQGAVSGLVGISRDITLRREFEDALRKYERIVAATPDYIALVTPDYRYLIVNDAYARLARRPAQEFAGHCIGDFWGADMLTLAKPNIDGCIADGGIKHEDAWLEIKEIGRRFLSMTYSPYVDADGARRGVVMSARDITQIKQTEIALAEERRLLQTLIDTLPDHIYVKDTQSRFLLANKASILGLGAPSLEYLLGKTDRDLFPSEEAEQFLAEEAALFASGQPIYSKEVYNVFHEHDDIYWFTSTKVPFWNMRGEVAGLVGINHDITDRKRAEEQLRAAHEELREKNAQLHHLNASKDKFFSIIAHDLRSPFTALIGLTQVLAENIERYTQAQLKSNLEKLQTSAERVFSLLENLLTWSRIQRGLMEYTPDTLPLGDISAMICDVFMAAAEQKQIRLSRDVPRECKAHADDQMVMTIMRNLVSNALKFTPQGGNIYLSAADAGNDVEIAVADSGVGIPPRALEKLFRIDEHHTTVGTAGEKGTGLGLILCHDLVKTNGGTMRVESEVGKGTTFRFTLPKPS